jgi:hypothetical protein
MRIGLIRRRIFSWVVLIGLVAVGLSGCIVVPVPGYASYAPGYGTPPPVYGAPAAVYVAPPPVYFWGPWWWHRRWR